LKQAHRGLFTATSPTTISSTTSRKAVVSKSLCWLIKVDCSQRNIGKMPPQLAAMQQTNINVQSLVVEAALTRKREHIYHAAMLDPHTAAELSLDQIWSLVDELITAHGDMLPEYQ